jgi:hypothetical protein
MKRPMAISLARRIARVVLNSFGQIAASHKKQPVPFAGILGLALSTSKTCAG